MAEQETWQAKGLSHIEIYSEASGRYEVTVKATGVIDTPALVALRNRIISAHWGGEVLFLGDRRLLTWVNGMPDEVDVSPWRVWRILAADELAKLLIERRPSSTLNVCLYAGDSEQDARAAFRRGEDALLGRGEA